MARDVLMERRVAQAGTLQARSTAGVKQSFRFAKTFCKSSNKMAKNQSQKSLLTEIKLQKSNLTLLTWNIFSNVWSAPVLLLWRSIRPRRSVSARYNILFDPHCGILGAAEGMGSGEGERARAASQWLRQLAPPRSCPARALPMAPTRRDDRCSWGGLEA